MKNIRLLAILIALFFLSGNGYGQDYYSMSESEFAEVKAPWRKMCADAGPTVDVDSCNYSLHYQCAIELLRTYPLHPHAVYYPYILRSIAACFESPEMMRLKNEAKNQGSDEIYREYNIARDKVYLKRAEELEAMVDFSVEDEEQAPYKIYLAVLYSVCSQEVSKGTLPKGYTARDYCAKKFNWIMDYLKNSSIPSEKFYGIRGFSYTPYSLRYKDVVEKFPGTMIGAFAHSFYLDVLDARCNEADLRDCDTEFDREVLKAYQNRNFDLPGFIKGEDQHKETSLYGRYEGRRERVAVSRVTKKGHIPWGLAGKRDPRNTLLGVPGTIERVPPLTGDETLEEILRLNETPPVGYELVDLIQDNELAKKAFAEAGWKYDPDGVDGPEQFRMAQSATAPINQQYKPMKPGKIKIVEEPPIDPLTGKPKAPEQSENETESKSVPTSQIVSIVLLLAALIMIGTIFFIRLHKE